MLVVARALPRGSSAASQQCRRGGRSRARRCPPPQNRPDAPGQTTAHALASPHLSQVVRCCCLSSFFCERVGVCCSQRWILLCCVLIGSATVGERPAVGPHAGTREEDPIVHRRAECVRKQSCRDEAQLWCASRPSRSWNPLQAEHRGIRMKSMNSHGQTHLFDATHAPISKQFHAPRSWQSVLSVEKRFVGQENGCRSRQTLPQPAGSFARNLMWAKLGFPGYSRGLTAT
jgi:hypothetical protein